MRRPSSCGGVSGGDEETRRSERVVRRATTRDAVVSTVVDAPETGRQAMAKPTQCDQSGECGLEMPSMMV